VCVYIYIYIYKILSSLFLNVTYHYIGKWEERWRMSEKTRFQYRAREFSAPNVATMSNIYEI